MMARRRPAEWVLRQFWVFLVVAVHRSQAFDTGLTARLFRGFHNLHEVQCTGRTLPSGSNLYAMVLYEKQSDRVLSLADLSKKQCSTASDYVSCQIDATDSKKSLLKVLVVDIAEGQSRAYGCNASILTAGGRFRVVSWSVVVRHQRTTTTSTPTTTTSTTTTLKPPPPGEAPIASGVKSNVQEFQLPISVVIIGLVLLLFFAILCAILVILQCRGKRRRRSRAANRESLLSTKSEPVGGDGGYRTTRSITGYPPGQMPPETPGGNFAMRYQKSIPDTGYVSGSSVYYSEPYGTLDEEMKERLRPNPRMCHIPYDLKGGPLDTHPQEHSA